MGVGWVACSPISAAYEVIWGGGGGGGNVPPPPPPPCLWFNFKQRLVSLLLLKILNYGYFDSFAKFIGSKRLVLKFYMYSLLIIIYVSGSINAAHF